MKKNTKKTGVSHGNEASSEANRSGDFRKKHRWVNLRKNGFARFQLGLIVALLLAYLGLEASFKKIDLSLQDPAPIESELVEYAMPNWKAEETKVTHKATEKKITNPNVFKIVPDDADTTTDPPTFIEPTIVDGGDGNLNPDDIVYESPIEDDPIIPITVVEEVPVFPGCEKVKPSERLGCFNQKMQKHVRRNFRYPDAAIQLKQEGKVSAVFVIGTDGEIVDIKLRGPSKILEKEARRILDKLPEMTPGKHNGKAVRVPFSIPINFQLQ